MQGGATNDTINGIVDFGGARTPGALSTFNLNDTIDGGAGTNTLNLTVQNAGASVAAVTAVDQVNYITFASAGGTDGTVQVTLGSTQVTLAATGLAAADIADLVVSTINSLAGQTIADEGNWNGTAWTAAATGESVQVDASYDLGAVLAAGSGTLTGITNQLFSSYVAGVEASTALTLTATETSNTEIVNLMNSTGQSVSADAGNWGGATQIWNKSVSTGNTIVLTDVAVGTALGISGKADSTATFANGSSSSPLTNGAVTLAVAGAGTSTSARSSYDITSGINNTFTTLNVNSASGKNFVDVVGSAITSVKTVNVTGAGTLDVIGATASTLDNVTIVDASAATGGVTIALQDNAKNVTITGGAGNDVFDMDDHLTNLDVIDGGAGVNTVRVIDTSLTASTDAAIKGINATTNIQTFQMTGATATLDASKVTVLSNFAFSSTGAVAVSGLANTDTVSILNAVTGADGTSGAGTNALTFAPSSDTASNVLTLSVKGDITGGDAGGAAGGGGDGLSAATFETVNLTVLAGTTFAGGAESVSGGDGDDIIVADNATITITGGEFALTLGTINGLNTTVDASGLGGNLTVIGDAGINVITGGAGDDNINGADGRDTINLGSGGNDTVVLATTVASRDVITGFTAGTNSNEADVLDGGLTVSFEEFEATATSFAFASDNVVAFSFEATNNSADLSAATDGTELFKAIANQGSTATISVGSAGATGFIVAYQDSEAYVYYFNAGSGNTAVVASEVSLVATLDAIDVGAFVAGNFT